MISQSKTRLAQVMGSERGGGYKKKSYSSNIYVYAYKDMSHFPEFILQTISYAVFKICVTKHSLTLSDLAVFERTQTLGGVYRTPPV